MTSQVLTEENQSKLRRFITLIDVLVSAFVGGEGWGYGKGRRHADRAAPVREEREGVCEGDEGERTLYLNLTTPL